MAMFYFIKGLSGFSIVAEPCADRILLFGGFTVALHHTLDVGGSGGKKRLYRRYLDLHQKYIINPALPQQKKLTENQRVSFAFMNIRAALSLWQTLAHGKTFIIWRSRLGC